MSRGKASLAWLREQERGWRLGVWLLTLLYTVLFVSITFTRHACLQSTTFDLGIFDQSVWLMSRGEPLFLTTRGLHVLGDHCSLILFPISVLYWIWADPRALLLIQTLVCALGALPIYHIARLRWGKPEWGLLFSLAYLSYPALQWMNWFDFHPEAIGGFFLLCACYYLECRRTRPFIAYVILALLCKEMIGITVILLGIYAGIRVRPRVGVVTVAIGLIALAANMIILQHFNHGEPSAYISLYAAYGSSPYEIARSLLSHPGRTIAALSTESNFEYLIELLTPVMLFALVAPELLVIAIPTLLANMLSNRSSMHSIYNQYNATVIPFIFVATITGMHATYGLLTTFFPKHSIWVRRSLVLSLSVGIVLGLQKGPLVFPFERTQESGLSITEADSIRDTLSTIPATSSVSAQTAIAAQLTDRKFIYMFPNPFEETCWGNSPRALQQQVGLGFAPPSAHRMHSNSAHANVEYVVLGPWHTSHFPLSDNEYGIYVAGMLTDLNYGVIRADRVIILKRGADYVTGIKLLSAASSEQSKLLDFARHALSGGAGNTPRMAN